MDPASEVVALFERKGDARYGHEAVSQLEHALQAGWAAEKAGATSSLIAAALVHDIGHVLHDLPDDAPDHGVDDHHENSGYRFLLERFGRAVAEPVRQHVAAKRYLCAVEPDYYDRLSGPSVTSLNLQGGKMTAAEVAEFESQPFFRDSVELRRWDDEAKIPGLATPTLEHFRKHLAAAVRGGVDTGG